MDWHKVADELDSNDLFFAVIGETNNDITKDINKSYCRVIRKGRPVLSLLLIANTGVNTTLSARSETMVLVVGG